MKLLPEALTFDDVLLVPAESSVLPTQTEIKTQLAPNIKLNIPIIIKRNNIILITSIK